MKFAIPIACAVLLISGAAHATGGSYYSACASSIAEWFNSASCEAMTENLTLNIMTAPHPEICLPANFKPPQATPIVESYMRNNPAKSGLSESNIVYWALMTAYPCPPPVILPPRR